MEPDTRLLLRKDDIMNNSYLSISQLSQYVKKKFDRDPYLQTVYLKGEISNSARNRVNSTLYFSLKDDQAVVNAVMFSRQARQLPFQLEDGMSVLVTGRLTTYGPRSQYQIIVEDMQQDGIGQLYQAYEKLKQQLLEEGLFDQAHKQHIVRFPKRIAVVTSKSGAVIQDIISTINRRFPHVELVLYETMVQGEKAIDSVAENIRQADQTGSFDTIIIGRGGGSIEDLWAFNDEKVVRAIFEAKTPIISSVGHETDTTLADLVADLRAPTPTAAAELAVPNQADLLLTISNHEQRLKKQLVQQVAYLQERLDRTQKSYIFKQPHRLYEKYVQQVDEQTAQLTQLIEGKVAQQQISLQNLTKRLDSRTPDALVQAKKEQANQLTQRLINQLTQQVETHDKHVNYLIEALNHLSPLNILSRGYSYTTKEDTIVKSVQSVQAGEQLRVHMADGALTVTVNDKHIEGADNQ